MLAHPVEQEEWPITVGNGRVLLQAREASDLRCRMLPFDLKNALAVFTDSETDVPITKCYLALDDSRSRAQILTASAK